MSRVKGPVWKTSRRLGFSILETGGKNKKNGKPPSQHRPNKPGKINKNCFKLEKNFRNVHTHQVSTDLRNV